MPISTALSPYHPRRTPHATICTPPVPQIQVPEDEDEVQEELRSLGLRPAPRRAPRKRDKGDRKKKKARKPTRLRAVTNVHLMELIMDTTADRID